MKLFHRRDYSLSGGYRKIIVKPGNLGWQLMHYDDYTKPLILGDLDIINKVVVETTPAPGMSCKVSSRKLGQKENKMACFQ